MSKKNIAEAALKRLIREEVLGLHGAGMGEEDLKRTLGYGGIQLNKDGTVTDEEADAIAKKIAKDKPGRVFAYSRGAAALSKAALDDDMPGLPPITYVAPAALRKWTDSPVPKAPGGSLTIIGDKDSAVPVKQACKIARQAGTPLYVYPGKSHKSILYTKGEVGGDSFEVDVDGCVADEEMPDWGASAMGSDEEVSRQQNAVLKHRKGAPVPESLRRVKSLIREYVRHVIKESTGSADLAVVVSHHSSRAIAVLYDVEAFLSTVPSGWQEAMVDGSLDVVNSLADNVVKGYISLGSPGSHGNCDGAWIVGRAAGPGYGREVYSVGYALSPNGRLAPDRNGVTDAAYNAWASAWKKSEYKKRPMDDSNHVHALKGNEYHTDDPADDCGTYPPYMMKHGRDPRVVNHTYQGTGDEKALLAGMQARHKELVGYDPGLQAAFEEAMLEAGDTFFDMHYPGTASW